MISRIKNQVNLHAASEVLNEFIVSNKTFKECCLEYSIYNIGEIFSAVILNNEELSEQEKYNKLWDMIIKEIMKQISENSRGY